MLTGQLLPNVRTALMLVAVHVLELTACYFHTFFLAIESHLPLKDNIFRIRRSGSRSFAPIGIRHHVSSRAPHPLFPLDTARRRTVREEPCQLYAVTWHFMGKNRASRFKRACDDRQLELRRRTLSRRTLRKPASTRDRPEKKTADAVRL